MHFTTAIISCFAHTMWNRNTTPTASYLRVQMAWCVMKLLQLQNFHLCNSEYTFKYQSYLKYNKHNPTRRHDMHPQCMRGKWWQIHLKNNTLRHCRQEYLLCKTSTQFKAASSSSAWREYHMKVIQGYFYSVSLRWCFVVFLNWAGIV